MTKILATCILLTAITAVKGKIIDNELTKNYNDNNNINRISSELQKNQHTSPSKSVAGLMQTVLCRHFPAIPCKLIMEDKTLRTLIERTVKQIKQKRRSINNKPANEGDRKVNDRDYYESDDGLINDEDLSNFLAVKHTGLFVEPDKQKAFRKKKKHNTGYKEQQNKRRAKQYAPVSSKKYTNKDFNNENYLQGDRPSKSIEVIAGPEYSKLYAVIPALQEWKKNTGRRDFSWNNYQEPIIRKTDDSKDKKTVKSYRKDVLRPDLYIKKKFARMNNVNKNKSFAFDTAECESSRKSVKLAGSWWREPKIDEATCGNAAQRLWRLACGTLVAPGADEAWKRVVEITPPDTFWHSLGNCVAHQAEVWQGLLSKGMDDVIQPAAFKLAIVMRHTPTELTARLLADLLRLHPQSQDLISYILALLTDDEAGCNHCIQAQAASGENSPISPAPLRDLQLFGDCELSVLGASPAKYEAHAKLVRAEYSKLTQKGYLELRIRILNQLAQVPKLYHTPEFEHFDRPARENIEREIQQLREELLTAHGRT